VSAGPEKTWSTFGISIKRVLPFADAMMSRLWWIVQSLKFESCAKPAFVDRFMASWIDTLEKRGGKFAVDNLTFWIMIFQIGVWGMGLFTNFPVNSLALDPEAILQGQVWRVFTFLFIPPIAGISFWLIFIWYLFYFFGSTLEKEWGEFRYNLFILLGVLATVIASFLTLAVVPSGFWAQVGGVPNSYLLTSVTVAFAILFPNFELLLFFILPVKMKWIALFTLAMWVLTAGTSPLLWLLIIAALANIAVFFGKSFLQGQQARQRRQKFEHERKADQEAAFHTCVVCGKTDQDDPDMEFAYKDGQGYCRDHWEQMDAR